MEDLTSAAAAYYHKSMMALKQQPEILPEQEQLKCPRCDSPNTKFCYYNNYNLSQPRHFCKNCRRYWTKGGALRNIPVGGGSRKNTKRTGSGSGSGSGNQKKIDAIPDLRAKRNSESEAAPDLGSNRDEEERITGNSGQELDPTRMLLYGLPIGDQMGGSFSSLLATNMQMGGIIFDGLSENGSRLYPGLGMGYRRNETANDGGGCGGGENAWTDLAIKRVEKN